MKDKSNYEILYDTGKEDIESINANDYTVKSIYKVNIKKILRENDLILNKIYEY